MNGEKDRDQKSDSWQRKRVSPYPVFSSLLPCVSSENVCASLRKRGRARKFDKYTHFVLFYPSSFSHALFFLDARMRESVAVDDTLDTGSASSPLRFFSSGVMVVGNKLYVCCDGIVEEEKERTAHPFRDNKQDSTMQAIPGHEGMITAKGQATQWHLFRERRTSCAYVGLRDSPKHQWKYHRATEASKELLSWGGSIAFTRRLLTSLRAANAEVTSSMPVAGFF